MSKFLNYLAIEILHCAERIIELDEPIKRNHYLSVAYIAKKLGERFCPDAAMDLYTAGFVHDVGTMDIPDRYVHQLNAKHTEVALPVKIHPQKGAAIIASIPEWIPIAKMVLDHHEWFDGSGYPRGLKGGQISLESQILRIADRCAYILQSSKEITFDSLKKHMDELVGQEFSPEIYQGLLDLMGDKKFFNSVTNPIMLESKMNSVSYDNAENEAEERLIDQRLLWFLGSVMDTKNSYTEGHSRRVAYFSSLVALALNLPDAQIRNINTAAYLHDIGKLGISNKIIDKKGPLTTEEFAVMKKHAAISIDILEGSQALKGISHILGKDQERFDGTGYPFGMKGDEIPLEARIIAIADAFDAMTSKRSYRRPVSVKRAIKELKRSAGNDFDPHIVSVACKIFEGFTNSSVVSSYVDVI